MKNIIKRLKLNKSGNQIKSLLKIGYTKESSLPYRSKYPANNLF